MSPLISSSPGLPNISPTSSTKSSKVYETDKILVPPLEDYIPLGCISWQTSCCGTDNQSAERWVEIEDTLPNVYGFPDVWNALLKLWRAAWIRVFRPLQSSPPGFEVWRLYILPADVFRGAIDRHRPGLKKSLHQLLSVVDVSPITWQSGQFVDSPLEPFDRWATAESSSLFYLFNTLPSPDPYVDIVPDRWSRAAMESLLTATEEVPGLATPLYPYQKRAAAEMLRREIAPQTQLDPRLEERQDPATGKIYYYGSRDELFLRHPRFYDAVRGGILAETMGLGKTLICIAIVLSTRGHFPNVPPQYADSRTPIRPRVGSLVDMAASTISRNSIPWRRFFDDLRDREGLEMDQCVKALERYPPKYEIPPVFVRSHRNSTFSSPSEVVQMCSTTIIVVPKNLMHQWRTELSKHVHEDVLKVLLMEDRHTLLPPPEVLASYDVILFSRTRFEAEHKGSNEFYESPLTKLHWFRIIIDEGHSFSAANTHAAIVAERLVRADRRWVVSGTPAKDLMGVEVEMATMINEGDYEDIKALRQQSLEQRKLYNPLQEEFSGAMKSLGSLTSRFLQAQPWATTTADQFEAPVRWDDYVYRHESYAGKTYTSFSTCLRRTLENLVIKTQPEDVERDIVLPPLNHRIVKLDPSFIDKLTANLFVLLFTTNAVTSERRDQDYLFHKASQNHLHRLIANLRQSAFYWTGLQEDSVRSCLEVTSKYLAKVGTDCGPEDKKLLEDTANAAQVALESALWKSITQTSDMGIFVKHFPEKHARYWAYGDCEDPMAMSLSLSIKAQNYVNDRLSTSEPTEGLDVAGDTAKLEALRANEEQSNPKSKANKENNSEELDVPKIEEDVQDSIRLPAHGASIMTSPQKRLDRPMSKSERAKSKIQQEDISKPNKRKLHAADASVELSPDSELGSSAIIGTTSAKLTYLIDRVVELHSTEKILIFYDGNHIAFFLSEIFDLLNIKYLLYANTLSGERRGKYVVLFDTDPNHRVMLMDIKQAAHGLNLSSASRVFFVNPVFRPNIEAQAIKRAHRIGQSKPVFVETLVLKGTVEEAMHERATKMTNHEHLQAKAIEDDGAMARIIQEARVLPIKPAEMTGTGQIAQLKTPQQIFGRPGRSRDPASKLELELFGDDVKFNPSKRSKSSKEVQLRNKPSNDMEKAEDTLLPPQIQASRSFQPAIQSSSSSCFQSLFGGD